MNIIAAIVLILIVLAVAAWFMFPSFVMPIAISGILAAVLIGALAWNHCKRSGN